MLPEQPTPLRPSPPQSDYSKGLGTDILPNPKGPTFQADQLPNWKDEKGRPFPWYPNRTTPPCQDKVKTLFAKCWDEGSVFVRTSDVCKCKVLGGAAAEGVLYYRSTFPDVPSLLRDAAAALLLLATLLVLAGQAALALPSFVAAVTAACLSDKSRRPLFYSATSSSKSFTTTHRCHTPLAARRRGTRCI